MNEKHAGLVMTGMIFAMCGSVIVLTEPLRRRREELSALYQNQERNPHDFIQNP